ncbi:MAG: AAA family ATPase [Chloroflexi bacterium]|jgi:nitric oxide reductase NorQ protein|nr:AAA family ATPase [Chloroflexota bacterium]MCH2531865.1 CbbQ/NirQ/NorQ/GpvN family protein [Dehalococcoidia bacterium]HCH35665.1 AAA family ATPase [Dehalococcoidia bacterium]|tara:strand:+ start:751 stop:1620 length:870 start_codon:yes stop_codon:yes gene_type:complete
MAEKTKDLYQQHNIEEYFVEDEPYYLPVGDEIEIFEAAYAQRVPILLKGPTGSGKTRFVEHMSWRLNDTRKKNDKGVPISPLVTVACHEDLTASDLVGRYLLEPEGTRWIDGPLTRAVKHGGICYLDEVVEARKDTTVLIHPLADHRRLLHIEKIGEVLESHPNFLLVISYNPGYQSALKDLKHSTRQRFVAIEFDFPPRELEGPIIEHESSIESSIASQLALLGEKIRNLVGQGLQEGVSTRLLIYAGKLIQQGISPRRACEVAVVWGLTDDHETQASVMEVVTSIFP